MRRILFGFVFLSVVFTATRFGHQVTSFFNGDLTATYAVLVLSYLGGAAIVPTIRRRRSGRDGAPVRFHVFFTAILLIAYPLAVLLYLSLKAIQDIFKDVPAVQFVLGTDLSQIYWAILVSYPFVALLVLTPLFSMSMFSANWLLGQYPGFNRLSAARYLFDVQLGIHKAHFLVTENKIQQVRPPAGALSALGGPGFLVVEEGHALITMRGGRVERIVGTGITYLKPFERPHQVVYLMGRGELCEIKNVVTRDHIVIPEIKLRAFHRLERGNQSHTNGQLSFEDRIILERVWSPNGSSGDWRDSVKSVADGALRDVVARHPLEEVVSVGADARARLKRELIEAMNQITTRLGVTILSVDFGAMELPHAAEQELLARGLSEVKRRTIAIQAEAQHDQIVTLADAERYKKMVEAHGERSAKITLAEAERNAAMLKAESDRAQQIAGAEAQKQSKITVSEGEREAKFNEAEAEKIMRLAKGEADKQALLWKGEARADAVSREEYARAQGAAERIRQMMTAMHQRQFTKAEVASLILSFLRENEVRRMRSFALMEQQAMLSENDADMASLANENRRSTNALPDGNQ